MRLKALDILRAVAVLLVIGRHFDIVRWWTMAGWTGVNLFFVLSGFLISGLLFSEYRKYGHIQVGRFLVRRGFKIYPSFYLLMCSTVAIFVLYHPHGPAPWRRFIGEFLFVQNYYDKFWSHTWSLAVEEHFYLALPVLLLLLARASKNRTDPFRSLPAISLTVAIAVLAARMWVCWPSPALLETIPLETHYQIDSLLFGVLISYFFHFRQDSLLKFSARNRPLLALVSLGFVAPCLYLDLLNSYFIQTAGHTLLYLGYGGIVLLVVTPAESSVGAPWKLLAAAGAGLAYIGRYSYSIYLWHIPVNTWGLDFLERVHRLPSNRLLQFSIYLIGSLVLGVAMSKLVEYPSLKLRDRLFPSRSPVILPAASEATLAILVSPASSSSGMVHASEPPIPEEG